MASTAIEWLTTRGSRHGHAGRVLVPFRRRENGLQKLLRSVGAA